MTAPTAARTAVANAMETEDFVAILLPATTGRVLQAMRLCGNPRPRYLLTDVATGVGSVHFHFSNGSIWS
jgi:hypothetical protein